MVVSVRMESHRVKEQSTTIKVIKECLDGPGISGSKGHVCVCVTSIMEGGQGVQTPQQ